MEENNFNNHNHDEHSHDCCNHNHDEHSHENGHSCSHDHNHDHNHECGHNHGLFHNHSHAPEFSEDSLKNFGKAFAIGALLNIGFVIVELAVGFKVNSLALIADAGHNVSDVLGLLISWVAYWATKQKPRGQFTYGFGHSTIIASLANSVLLFVAAGAIASEAIARFFNPAPQSGGLIMAVAFIGVIINFATAFLFMKGQKEDLNIKSTFLHMMFDGLVSVGVIIAGGLIILTKQSWIDPLVSLIIVFVIVFGSFGLLAQSFKMSLAAAPDDVAVDEVKKYIRSFDNIESFHDLHIWPLSTTKTAISAHIIVKNIDNTDSLLKNLSQGLASKFNIKHSTFQIENNDDCCNDNCSHD